MIQKINLNSNFNVYCTYHSDSFIKEFNLEETDNFKLFNSTSEMNEDNINHLNRFYNEFVTQYWAYKNDKVSDYIGFCHYRRRFDLDKIDLSILNDNTCYVIANYGACSSLFHIIEDWKCDWIYQDYIDYASKKYGTKHPYYTKSNNIDSECPFECYIMTRNKFNELFEFVFSFIEYINTKYDLNFDEEKTYSFLDNRRGYEKFIHKPRKYNYLKGYGGLRMIGYFIEFMIKLFIDVNFDTKIVNCKKGEILRTWLVKK